MPANEEETAAETADPESPERFVNLNSTVSRNLRHELGQSGWQDTASKVPRHAPSPIAVNRADPACQCHSKEVLRCLLF